MHTSFDMSIYIDSVRGMCQMADLLRIICRGSLSPMMCWTLDARYAAMKAKGSVQSSGRAW